MAACEKCWKDAGCDPYGSFERYRELLNSRTCTPEEQAGDAATKCPRCKRKTVHQYAKCCMVPGCRYAPRVPGRFQPDAAGDHEFGAPGATKPCKYCANVGKDPFCRKCLRKPRARACAHGELNCPECRWANGQPTEERYYRHPPGCSCEDCTIANVHAASEAARELVADMTGNEVT